MQDEFKTNLKIDGFTVVDGQRREVTLHLNQEGVSTEDGVHITWRHTGLRRDGADGAVLMAHYAPFDVGAIAFAHVRQGRGVPEFFILDTFTLSKQGVPGLPKYSLSLLAENLGLPTDDHHRALPDARATRLLFQHCIEKFGDPDEMKMSDLFEKTGAPLTFEDFTTLPLDLPESLQPIEEAIAEGRDLTIEYRGGSRGGTPRLMTPSHLFARDGHVYLEGVCHLSGKKKSFRLDRIDRASVVTAAPRKK